MKSLVFSLFLFTTLFAQAPDSSVVLSFFNDAAAGKDISNYLLPEESDIAVRLGISYSGITNKSLIGNEIPAGDAAYIKKHPDDIHLTYFPLEDGFTKVHAGLPSRFFEMEFIWKGNYIVSAPWYYSRNWERSDSKYFNFIYSKPENYNGYAAAFMDSEVEKIAQQLNYTQADLERLAAKKILFFLCNEKEEVEQLTGYEARGIYLLSHDYIVSSYNTHVHEVAHLLMNYKLKNLPLYFHPFLQEGFAVAMGGRGGKSVETILRLGSFTVQSGFGDYPAILSISGFIGENSSLVYPLAGIYTTFLLNKIPLDDYLQIYTKYEGEKLLDKSVTIDSTLLPTYDEWNDFIDAYDREEQQIILTGIPDESTVIVNEPGLVISEKNDYYYFKTDSDLLIADDVQYPGYQSAKFYEIYPKGSYNGEKYLITVTEQEISLYNLLTNTLNGKYALGLSLTMQPVPKEEDCYTFGIRKDLFDEKPLAEFITKLTHD